MSEGEDRTPIHLLAVCLFLSQERKVDMEDCLVASEALLGEAEMLDFRAQQDRELQEKKAAEEMKVILSGKVQ
jgi:hypothetical protein